MYYFKACCNKFHPKNMIYLCVILAALLIHVRASQAAIVSSQNDTRTISVIAVDGLSSAVVTGLTMTLWDTSDPATPIWLGRATTNELGKVDFRSSQLNESNTTSLRVTTKYFNGRKFTSNTFSGETPFTFKIGTFRAEISDGSHKESPPLSHTKIGLVRFSPATLRDEWIATYHTDQAGILIANLPTFDDGYIYKLASVNNDSQELSYSPIIQSSGEYALAIGSLPASLLVFDLVEQTFASETKVILERKVGSSDWEWVDQRRTSSDGSTSFQPPSDESDQDIKYRYKVSKYRGNAYSQEFITPNKVSMNIGAVRVEVINESDNQPIANLRVNAYRIRENGQLTYEAFGDSNSNGEIVFDLKELGKEPYVLKAIKPFKSVNHIFSHVISGEEKFSFSLSENDSEDLDTELPIVKITTPTSNKISKKGFLLSGYVTDNNKIEKLTISFLNKPYRDIQVENFYGQTWSTIIETDNLAADEKLEIKVEAEDNFGNKGNVTKHLTVSNDSDSPLLTIESHKDGDIGSKNGFTLYGKVHDNIQTKHVKVQFVSDSIENFDRYASIDYENDTWSLYLDSDSLPSEEDVTISVTAADFDNNQNTKMVSLTIGAPNFSIKHLISRTTFGLNQQLSNRITEITPEQWLDEQLSPSNIDDSLVEVKIADLDIQNIDALRKREFFYAIYSERQVQQIMASFWENHFSTNFNSHKSVGFEARENDQFRQLALTSFRELLEVSAKSPAMLMYLNNQQSTKNKPNENYARELLELHTLGVNGGYTNDDVVKVAQAFTGWQVGDDDQFRFNEAVHGFSPKTILGVYITEEGVSAGESILDLLADHPSTASFICEKLIEYLISDTSSSILREECSYSFRQTGGDIKSVLRAILLSHEFYNSKYVGKKVKSPFLMYVSAVRALNIEPNIEQAMDIISELGMPLFANPSPDGFSYKASDWLNPGSLKLRTEFAAKLVHQKYGGINDVINILVEKELNTPQKISLAYENILSSTVTKIELEVGLKLLADSKNADTFQILKSEKADLIINNYLAFLLSSPSFQSY